MTKNEKGKRKGSLTVEVIPAVVMILSILLFSIKISPVFIQWIELNHFANEVVRIVELEGGLKEKSTERIEKLSERTGLEPTITIDKSGNIQLGDDFVIELECEALLGKVFGIDYTIPLKAKEIGTSEVYYK